MNRPSKQSATARATTTDPDSDSDHLAKAMADVSPLAPDSCGRVRAAPAATTRGKAVAPTSSSASEPSENHGAGVDEGYEGYVAPSVDRCAEMRPRQRARPAGPDVEEAVANVKQFIEIRRQGH